jgi:hypothetical protein
LEQIGQQQQQPAAGSRGNTSWISATDFVHVGVGAAPAALAHEGLDDPAGSTAVFAAKSFFCNQQCRSKGHLKAVVA